MKKLAISTLLLCAVVVVSLMNCTPTAESKPAPVSEVKKETFGGYESAELYGEHLVTVCGCNDCHTPKKMTDRGPEPDSSLWLSGHPASMPAPAVDRADMAKRGLAVTDFLTAWVGPWGTTYAPNITGDETGIGTWSEQQFITCIREGKLKGLSRALLPPMPWQFYKAMTDGELKAIFAYLKSTKPIKNIAPAYEPPAAQ
ncbi:MAG: diheme cytochrome c-553 [Flavobacteriales bacterium]